MLLMVFTTKHVSASVYIVIVMCNLLTVIQFLILCKCWSDCISLVIRSQKSPSSIHSTLLESF